MYVVAGLPVPTILGPALLKAPPLDPSRWRTGGGAVRNPVRSNSEFSETNSSNCVSNLCRDQHEIAALPLVCARSGFFYTICSDVTQRRGFSSLHLRLPSHNTRPSFHTYRTDRAAVQTILADLTSAIPHHSQQGSTQSSDLDTFSRCLSSFSIGRGYAAFSSVSFCRFQSSD